MAIYEGELSAEELALHHRTFFPGTHYEGRVPVSMAAGQTLFTTAALSIPIDYHAVCPE